MHPFVIALYCGDSKPKSVDDYLSASITGFVCDAPARTFIECIKIHTGRSSSEICCGKGIYIDLRIVFENNCLTKRTNQNN